MAKPILDISKEDLVQLYKKELTPIKVIARKFHVGQEKVTAALDEFNIDRNTLEDYWALNGHPLRKYKAIDLDQLKSVEDEETAYLLGYLAWAGSFKGSKGTYMLTAHAKDKELLEGVLAILDIDNAIHKVNSENTKHGFRYQVGITQRGIKDAFSKWYYRADGTNPNKFPPKMPKRLLPFYLRGYFDRHMSVETANVTITGPGRDFVRQFKKCLANLGVTSKLINNTPSKGYRKSIYRLRFRRQERIDLYNLIYSQDFVIKSSRRQEALLKLVSRELNARTRRAETFNIIVELLQDGYTSKEVDGLLGVCPIGFMSRFGFTLDDVVAQEEFEGQALWV